MLDIAEAMRSFFEVRNRSWLSGDGARSAQVAREVSRQSWGRSLRDLAYRHRSSLGSRQTQILRTHSRVAVWRCRPSRDGHVDAETEEQIIWVYRDWPDYGVESRVIRHRQRWISYLGTWHLVEEKQSGESVESSRMAAAVLQPGQGNEPDARDGVGRDACSGYDRLRALRYADLWWNRANLAFAVFANDCTNFVSQCLLAGNLKMEGGDNRIFGWWYRFATLHQPENWSYSWTTSHALFMYLAHQLRAARVVSPKELKIGDVIFYDWSGVGRYQHTAIVTDFDGRGDPLVNAHTDSSYRRHYRYRDSRAWTPNTRYAYVHLPDDACMP